MAETLEYYKSRKWQTGIQIESRRRENARIKGEIEILEDAYNKMKNIKDRNEQNAGNLKERAKLESVLNKAGNVKWYGKSKQEFDTIMKESVTPAARTFYLSIDDMLDEIGVALSNKKSEYNSGIGILNRLNSSWNYFDRVVRNWLN